MKHRTQIQLDAADLVALRAFAQQQGISTSGAVRALVRQVLRPKSGSPDVKKRAFLSAAGSVASRKRDEGDVSRKHDEVLYGRGIH